MTNVTLTTQGKTITSALKNPQQLRQLQIQQQLLKQNKLGTTQKLSIAQVGGKNAVPTPLIFGATKPISTAMTVQQLQQVIRAPLNVSPGPVVLAKGPPRVIPVNTAQGTKHTIQVRVLELCCSERESFVVEVKMFMVVLCFLFCRWLLQRRKR